MSVTNPFPPEYLAEAANAQQLADESGEAVAKLEAIGEGLAPGARAVVLEMHQLVSIDTSGVDALKQLHRVLERQGVRLVVCALNAQPLALIRQVEFDAVLGAAGLGGSLIPSGIGILLGQFGAGVLGTCLLVLSILLIVFYGAALRTRPVAA